MTKRITPYAGNEKPFWVIFTDHKGVKRFYSSHDTRKEAEAMCDQQHNCPKCKAAHASEQNTVRAANDREGIRDFAEIPANKYTVIAKPKLVPLRYVDDHPEEDKRGQEVLQPNKDGTMEKVMVPDPSWADQE